MTNLTSASPKLNPENHLGKFCFKSSHTKQHQTHTEHNQWRTYNLFLCVLVGAQQVDCLHVSKVDVMAEQEDEEQLADVLLLAVAIQGLVPFKLGADVGQLFVDPFDLSLLALT